MTNHRQFIWLTIGILTTILMITGSTGMAVLANGESITTSSSGNVTSDINVNAAVDIGNRSSRSETGPPQIDSSLTGPPTDPDGDGKYEDVNGNGREDFDDVVQFFTHIRNPAVTDHVTAYDYNENGRIDFADLVELFRQV